MNDEAVQLLELQELQALENAKRILGEAGCAAKILRNAPIDWADVQRGRDLFVPGWGGFDIEAALELCNTTEDQSVPVVPSVQKLRSSGYVIKFFPETQDQIIRDRIQRVLQAPESLLSRYIIQHRSFWADARNANRLDEIEAYWLDFQRANPSRALKEDPKRLLNRLARDRAVAQHPLIDFHHLLGQQCAFFDEARILLPRESLNSENWSFELSVLEDSHSVLQAAQELNNCAADYVRNIRQKRCALIVLRSLSKLLAMGEWDLHSRRWSQISEHSDEPVRDEWLSMYRQMAEHSELFQVRCVLPLPEVELGTGWLQEVGEDMISIFSVDGATDLDSFCNASIFGMQPCFGWPSLLQRGCHAEACGALLLWTVASAHSNDSEMEDVEEVVERLLCQRADPDTMTDGGWNSLMFAVMAQKTSLVSRLLEAEADIDARASASGRTPLMLACSASVENFGLVCRLVTAAASLDFAARIDGRTALLQAVEDSVATSESSTQECHNVNGTMCPNVSR